MAGLEALDEAIAKIRELGIIAEKIAPIVARELQGVIAENIAAGRTADGEPWLLTKKGEQPLRGAAKAVEASASGSRVVLTVSGPEALHHLGRAKGGIAREILPRKTLPDAWIKSIERAVKRYVEE